MFKSGKSLAGIVLAVCASASSAVAGEGYNWSGIYLGGHLGGAWSTIDWDYYNLPGQSLTREPSGVVGGAHIGVQHQWNNLVLGAEFSWTGTFGGMDDRGLDAPIFAPAFDSYASINHIVAIGPRIGWAFDNRLLAYATGGYANADIETAFILRSTGARSTTSARLDGWFIGGGVDYALTNNWLLGVEYRHIELDRELVGPVNPPAVGSSRYLSPEIDTVTARVTYKFNRVTEEAAPLK